jgi:D-aminopeptidase
VFAASTGRKPLSDPLLGLTLLGAIAADVVARAVARAIYEAAPLSFPGALPSWQQRFGKSPPKT